MQISASRRHGESITSAAVASAKYLSGSKADYPVFDLIFYILFYIYVTRIIPFDFKKIAHPINMEFFLTVKFGGTPDEESQESSYSTGYEFTVHMLTLSQPSVIIQVIQEVYHECKSIS